MIKRVTILAVVAVMLSGSVCWAFDTDSFIANNLVLDVDAREPGDDPNRWQAVVGGAKPAEAALSEANGIPVDGFLVSCDHVGADPESDDGPYKPVYTEEAVDTNTLCYYRFDMDHFAGGGQARGYSTDLYFDFDDDFIVEAWVRVGPPECITDPCGQDCQDALQIGSATGINSAGRMTVASDCGASQTGWHMSARKISAYNYSFEFQMRDYWRPFPSTSSPPGITHLWGVRAIPADVMIGQWAHVVGIYRYDYEFDPVAHTGADDPKMWLAQDGELKVSPWVGNIRNGIGGYDPNSYPPPFPWIVTIWQEPNFIALPSGYAPWDRNVYALTSVGLWFGNKFGLDADGEYWSEKEHFLPFFGDIARVRVYNGEVSNADINDFITDLYGDGTPPVQGPSEPACWSWACQPFGDYSNDGFITSTDVSGLIAAWNAPAGTHDPCADFSHDGFITSTDVSILIASWNAGGCP